jgi:hypothetical protein
MVAGRNEGMAGVFGDGIGAGDVAATNGEGDVHVDDFFHRELRCG